MRKALVVDDEKKVRDLYKKFLTHKDFKVLEAANGEQAGMTLMSEEDIDLVLLDVRMPVVNGATLFDLIKLHHPSAKVVVASVYPIEDQKHLISGADGYFDKAEGTDRLFSRVQHLLRDSASPERSAQWQKEHRR